MNKVSVIRIQSLKRSPNSSKCLWSAVALTHLNVSDWPLHWLIWMPLIGRCIDSSKCLWLAVALISPTEMCVSVYNAWRLCGRAVGSGVCLSKADGSADTQCVYQEHYRGSSVCVCVWSHYQMLHRGAFSWYLTSRQFSLRLIDSYK